MATEEERKRKRPLVDFSDDDDEDEEVQPRKKTVAKADMARSCPYLDTINRQYLDFDFEKLCSVSLSHLNVYACLVCGKYFQGRGKSSFAYTHSVQMSHHVYINLNTLEFYCLPDNYQIIDASLEDIKYVLRPTFQQEQISLLDTSSKVSRALDSTTYQPGIQGLNNIKHNDYMNVLFHAFAHVQPLRNYFLSEDSYSHIKPKSGDRLFTLVQRLGEVFRKLWNPLNFKSHVSPHEMCQAVVLASKKKFQITKQGETVEFMTWLLHSLHQGLGGSAKENTSVVSNTFQGSMNVHSRKLPMTDNPDELKKLMQEEEYKTTTQKVPFFFLTLDLPAPPLFKDEFDANFIPQIPLLDLLSKFDGTQEKEYKSYKDIRMKRFEVTKLPPYLILVIKRFTKNNFFIEKNHTIVNFPIGDLDMAEFLSSDPAVQDAHPHTKYSLCANIVHDGDPGAGKGTYRVQLLHKGAKQWFELQDLHVTNLLPQMITLAEAYIQIWELDTTSEE
ncbi:ubiquitin carboxyl-terminal hydrolase 39-like [Sycon ciliatum]|uniref:ubiquitin carboxyl-terminal hydrolase 39-like n=1 Tax=Sycon ciliatum TaxID=27933 RepID=UPI0031F61E0B|eukprot:scpid58627/ scgid33547/ U4/U6.U5 tri-snRNP-associated protein 2; Inactive ubiquitin-specific peptidase 39; SAD1 homolog; U4/U6.U5 tri-snRNP-associated 65 kDa protein